MKTTIYSLFIILTLSACQNMTPEQQAQWSATVNAEVKRASDLAMDEAAIRLRKTRDNK